MTEWRRIFSFTSPFIIEAERATKTYVQAGREIIAVKDVSLKIKPGTLVVIVGPSAAGKTTLLHLFAGLIHPTQGRILFKGLDLSKAEDAVLKVLREEYISIVFQEQSLIRYLSARENIELPMELMGLREGDRRKASTDALHMVNMDMRRDHLVEELSGGERQRVNLARALAKEPQLVLADEPTANLDADHTSRLLKIIRQRVREKGTTFIVATHDPIIAEEADLILEMRDGRITVPEKETLDSVELLPLRYVNAELFSILRDTISDELNGEVLEKGDTAMALGTPYLVLSTSRAEGEEGGGVMVLNTRMILHHFDEDTRPSMQPPKGKAAGQPAEEDARIASTRVGHLRLLFRALTLITLLPSGFFLFYSLAIWYQLGIWTGVSTASLVVGLFFTLQVLLVRPSKLTALSVPIRNLCGVCGLRRSTLACHMCGRKICPECVAKVIREPPFCYECIACPVCGRDRVESPCLICGNYVCPSCYQDGMCLECASEHRLQPEPSGKLRTLILEPEEDIANEICAKLSRHLHRDLHGIRAIRGIKLLALGTRFKALATHPIGGGIITQSTHINPVNTRERDARLCKLRENSAFPVCYHEGCDYMIRRYCCICGKPACPNHSTICKGCGNVVCGEHHRNHTCTRCQEGPRRMGYKQTVREVLSPLVGLALPPFLVVLFFLILFSGEPLAAIHPALPLILIIALIILPIPYVLYSLVRRRGSRRVGVDKDLGRKVEPRDDTRRDLAEEYPIFRAFGARSRKDKEERKDAPERDGLGGNR